MQKFVFNLNTTSRWGGQSPFTNLTFDLKAPRHLGKDAVIVGGKLLDSTYADYQPRITSYNVCYTKLLRIGMLSFVVAMSIDISIRDVYLWTVSGGFFSRDMPGAAMRSPARREGKT